MVDAVKAFMQGLDRPLILWLLAQRPRHGYELTKEVKRLTGQKMKTGTVYPILYWLEYEDFVVGECVKKGRRELRRYRLTEKGRALLAKVQDLFNRPVRLLFADLLKEQKED